MLQRIKNIIINFYSEYQKEALLFNKHKQAQPEWEKKLLRFLILISIPLYIYLFFPIFILKFINEMFLNILTIIYVTLISFILYRSAFREFKEVSEYYKERAKNNNTILIQKRYIFTTFSTLKLAKPIIKTCIMCAGGAGAFIMTTGGIHHLMYPGQETPYVLLGEVFTKYTGYSPDFCKLPEAKFQEEIIILKEHVQNQDMQIQEQQKEIDQLRKEIVKKNSKWL